MAYDDFLEPFTEFEVWNLIDLIVAEVNFLQLFLVLETMVDRSVNVPDLIVAEIDNFKAYHVLKILPNLRYLIMADIEHFKIFKLSYLDGYCSKFAFLKVQFQDGFAILKALGEQG